MPSETLPDTPDLLDPSEVPYIGHLDRRTRRARRFEASLLGLVSDRGGLDHMSAAERTLARQAAGLISQITAASGQQSQGIEQINRSLGEMDKATQEAAAQAEESAAAAQELREQAGRMSRLAVSLSGLVGRNGQAGPEARDPGLAGPHAEALTGGPAA